MKKNIPNILVTGGTGYIGSHLIKTILSSLKTRVVSIDKKTSPNQKYLKGCIFIKGDVGDKELTLKILKKYNIDVVFHLAALIRTEESMKKPQLYFKNNVIAGLSLLESMRKCGRKKIIYSSSAAVYGISGEKSIRETQKKRPVNIYGLTKLWFEELLDYYKNVYGFNYVIFRLFNVAGADPESNLQEFHKPETHLIPLTIRSIFFKKPLKVYGTNYNTLDGTCVRDYIHVGDISQAFIMVLPKIFKKEICDVFNLGSEKGHSVLQVINMCKKIIKKNLDIKYYKRREGDSAALVADCKKARKILGWETKYNFEDIISDTKNSLYK